jgi:RNA polymerase sigma-70 factor (ECF subfamily)
MKDLSVESLCEKDLSLDQLLQRCLLSADEETWTDFIRGSQPVIASVVIKTARRWTRPSSGLIDDLIQETYLKLCLNDFRALRLFGFRHENALFGFLKVVASNVVRDHFRETYTQKRGCGMLGCQLDCAPSSALLNGTFEAVERAILLGTVDRCLENSKSARDRLIFWLYYRDGLTAKAISALPSIRLSVKGVESTISRLVRLIKLKLNEAPTNKPAQRD